MTKSKKATETKKVVRKNNKVTVASILDNPKCEIILDMSGIAGDEMLQAALETEKYNVPETTSKTDKTKKTKSRWSLSNWKNWFKFKF